MQLMLGSSRCQQNAILANLHACQGAVQRPPGHDALDGLHSLSLSTWQQG